MIDYKFKRTEIGKVTVSGIYSNFDDYPEFIERNFIPFIGYLNKL